MLCSCSAERIAQNVAAPFYAFFQCALFWLVIIFYGDYNLLHVRCLHSNLLINHRHVFCMGKWLHPSHYLFPCAFSMWVYFSNAGFSLTCGTDGCKRTYTYFRRFKDHLRKAHPQYFHVICVLIHVFIHACQHCNRKVINVHTWLAIHLYNTRQSSAPSIAVEYTHSEEEERGVSEMEIEVEVDNQTEEYSSTLTAVDDTFAYTKHMATWS